MLGTHFHPRMHASTCVFIEVRSLMLPQFYCFFFFKRVGGSGTKTKQDPGSAHFAFCEITVRSNASLHFCGLAFLMTYL